MASNGAATPVAEPYEVDPTQLQKFIGTGNGQRFANVYKPGMQYAQVGSTFQEYDPAKDSQGSITGRPQLDAPNVTADVTNMLNAYNQWLNGNQQTNANWQNYANTVNANNGGEGDNTITSGAAEGSRQLLLGSLATPTTPTPGLGSMGSSTLTKNGVALGSGR